MGVLRCCCCCCPRRVVVVAAAVVVVAAALPAILMGFIKVLRWSWKGRVHCPELLGLIGLKLFFSGHVECFPVGCFKHAVFSMLGRWSQTGSHCHLGSSPSKPHHHVPFWNSHSLCTKTISKPKKSSCHIVSFLLSTSISHDWPMIYSIKFVRRICVFVAVWASCPPSCRWLQPPPSQVAGWNAVGSSNSVVEPRDRLTGWPTKFYLVGGLRYLL